MVFKVLLTLFCQSISRENSKIVSKCPFKVDERKMKHKNDEIPYIKSHHAVTFSMRISEDTNSSTYSSYVFQLVPFPQTQLSANKNQFLTTNTHDYTK